jgi:hypothetical protein
MASQVIDFMQEKYGTADWTRYEAQRWSYYDYARYPVAGVGAMSFFINPLGSVDPVSALAKTLEQTNMVKAGSFGQQYFVINAIRTHLFFLPKARQLAAIAALVRLGTDGGTNAFWESFVNVAHSGVARFYAQSKEIAQIPQPFIMAPPGMGLAIDRNAASTAGAAVITQSYYAQQSPYHGDVYCIPWRVIEPEVQFRFNIEWPNGVVALAQIAANNVAVDVGVLLDGYIIRPKQ